jgi:5'-methylthioadenosine phosphorylase
MASKPTGNPPRAQVGILGGTGLYEIEGIEDLREIRLSTPFGDPSDAYVVGSLEGKPVAFLSRHGRGHRLLPAEINTRANIFGFKLLGVERIISVSSVGSLREEIRPRDLVVVDQFFDRSRRVNTFFGGGIAAHVGFADPVCPDLSRVLYRSGSGRGIGIHPAGTYLCIEGPAFSSRAESRVYRTWGCDVIGMTGTAEAKLCREAEICYALLALVTDYDVWREDERPVSVEIVLENLAQNAGNAKAVLRKALAGLPPDRGETCGCGTALEKAIVTRPDLVPEATRKTLGPIVSKYLKPRDEGRT